MKQTIFLIGIHLYVFYSFIHTFLVPNVSNPEILHEGVLSDNMPQWNNHFNQKNQLGLFTKMDKNRSRIISYAYKNGVFLPGEFLPFDTRFNYSDPWMNKEGDYMLMQSNIGITGEVSKTFRICESFLTEEGWSQPAPIPELVNFNRNEGSPSLTANGNLYFNALNETGDYDIYVLKNGDSKPQRLSNNINAASYEGDFYIDDKEQFIVFSSANRAGSQGGSDLYISFKMEEDWTTSFPLNKGINSTAEDFSPYISEDRKRLIFTSNRNNTSSLTPSFNHYIVDFDIIELKSIYVD